MDGVKPKVPDNKRFRFKFDTALVADELDIMPEKRTRVGTHRVSLDDIWDWIMDLDFYSGVDSSEVRDYIQSKKVSNCELHEVRSAFISAKESAYSDAFYKELFSKIEDGVMNLGDYSYKYDYDTDEYVDNVKAQYEGKAIGIERVDVNWDGVTVIVHKDIVHIANELEHICGRFDPDHVEEEEIKDIFSCLLRYGRGEYADKVEIDYDRVERNSWGNDDKYIDELVREVCEVDDPDFQEWWIKEGEMDDEGDWL